MERKFNNICLYNKCFLESKILRWFNLKKKKIIAGVTETNYSENFQEGVRNRTPPQHVWIELLCDKALRRKMDSNRIYVYNIALIFKSQHVTL